MKLNTLTDWLRPEHTTLAMFGDARLVKHLNGKLELRGGTPADRIAAKEWCSLFMHNAAFDTSTNRVQFTPTRVVGL